MSTSLSTPRLFYWSIRREIWENRSIWIAPLVVTAVVLFSSLIATTGLPKKIRNSANLTPARQHSMIVKPYSMAPAPIMLATWLVGLFYAIDALYGERRDRSILFWKSLPISDTTTVLAKAAVPLVVLPAIAIVLSWVTVALLLLAGSSILLMSGLSPGRIWAEYNFVQEPMVMVYGMTAHALWFAPIYAWLLLVSAWARRAPLLWAVLPPFAIGAAERVIFGTSAFGSSMKWRAMGVMSTAFSIKGGSRGEIEEIWRLTPARFLSTPGLWLGLIVAAAFVFGAIRLRRAREPI